MYDVSADAGLRVLLFLLMDLLLRRAKLSKN
jgi:hypothetical protein